jgi:hypothetical protein
MASRFSRRDAKCRTEADHRATYRADHSLCVNWVTVQANEAPRHEAMRSVPPIVSSSRCVGRLRISDKENDRLSMTLAECRKQRQQCRDCRNVVCDIACDNSNELENFAGNPSTQIT